MRIEEAPGSTERREQRLTGIGVSAGIAIGAAYIGDGGPIVVSETAIADTAVGAERARFADAVANAQKQLRKLKARVAALPGSAQDEIGYLLDAHLAMLANSRLVRGVHQRIANSRINAERAVELEIETIAKGFAQMRDSYLAARVEDIRVVGSRLIRNLIKKPYVTYAALGDGAIILAEDVTPADTALMDPRRVGGFAAVFGGGPESHSAIMARALGLPAVMGVAGLVARAQPDATVIIDGSEGAVILDPTPSTLENYRRRLEEFHRERRHLTRLRRLAAVTRDGVEIRLEANLELPMELDQALANGAMGLGLVRTEFLFLNRDDLPDEDEQYEFYAGLVRGMGGRPVTLRTLDAGGDKLPEALAASAASGADPALGLRGIRLSLKERRLFDIQLAAMLRAAREGPLRILLPMISTTSEIRRTREAIEQVSRRLRRRGVAFAEVTPPLGVMIEVPGAALAADALASEADFFAIGTNDLIQYTLAIDRSDEQLAHLYNPLHPGVLRLIQLAVEAATRRRIPIGICGEMAGEPRYTALLLGLGLRELSMSPGSLPRIKQRIRNLDIVAATRRAEAIMDQSDSGRIAALLDDFNAMVEPA